MSPSSVQLQLTKPKIFKSISKNIEQRDEKLSISVTTRYEFFRGGSRAAATSKMECFGIIVAAALDLPPMNAVIVIFVNMVMLDLD